jgi:hypothetical protein
MKYCKKCDKTFEDEDSFCDTCGSNLTKKDIKDTKRNESYKGKKERHPAFWIFIGIFISLIIFSAFFYLYKDSFLKSVERTPNISLENYSNLGNTDCKFISEQFSIISGDYTCKRGSEISIQIRRGSSEILPELYSLIITFGEFDTFIIQDPDLINPNIEKVYTFYGSAYQQGNLLFSASVGENISCPVFQTVNLPNCSP